MCGKYTMASASPANDEAKSGGDHAGGASATIPGALASGTTMNQWEGGLLARAVRVVVTQQAPGVVVLEWYDMAVKDPRRQTGARRMMMPSRDTDDAGAAPKKRVGALRLQKHVAATRGICEGMHTAPPLPDDPDDMAIGPVSSRVCDADCAFSVVAKLATSGASDAGGAAVPSFGVYLEAGSTAEAEEWVTALNALCHP